MREKRSTVRIMTWNIHGAVGRNPRFDLMRVVELIKRADPDIVALQEVDSRRRSDGDDTFALLHELLGVHGIGAKSITGADGDYGQLLISRWPITQSEVHDISYPEREPRRAIKAEIDTRSQAKKLLDIAGQTPTTTVVVGDFNDWFWAGSVRAALARELPGRTRYRTFPSWLPLLRLDRIYCRPARALLGSRVETLARHVSDHICVVADIKPRV